MDSNFSQEIGGGFTLLGLLSILVHNFLVRKREESMQAEKFTLLAQQLQRIEQHQADLLLLITRLLEQTSLLVSHGYGNNKSDRIT